MTAQTITFDLTTSQGATDAASHVIARLGQRIVVACGEDLTRTSKLRPSGVTVWRNPDSYALMISYGMTYTFEGVIRISDDQEPERAGRWARNFDLIRRPVRRAEDACDDRSAL